MMPCTARHLGQTWPNSYKVQLHHNLKDLFYVSPLDTFNPFPILFNISCLAVMFYHISVISLLIGNLGYTMSFHTDFSCLQHSVHVVYFEMLYLAISCFSYSLPESTRDVSCRSSLVLWWIAIILLISLVPAVLQLNCWILLMLTLASTILLKSTVALSAPNKFIL